MWISFSLVAVQLLQRSFVTCGGGSGSFGTSACDSAFLNGGPAGCLCQTDPTSVCIPGTWSGNGSVIVHSVPIGDWALNSSEAVDSSPNGNNGVFVGECASRSDSGAYTTFDGSCYVVVDSLSTTVFSGRNFALQMTIRLQPTASNRTFVLASKRGSMWTEPFWSIYVYNGLVAMAYAPIYNSSIIPNTVQYLVGSLIVDNQWHTLLFTIQTTVPTKSIMSQTSSNVVVTGPPRSSSSSISTTTTTENHAVSSSTLTTTVVTTLSSLPTTMIGTTTEAPLVTVVSAVAVVNGAAASPTISIGAIIGIVIAAVTVCLLLVLGAFVVSRRRRRQHAMQASPAVVTTAPSLAAVDIRTQSMSSPVTLPTQPMSQYGRAVIDAYGHTSLAANLDDNDYMKTNDALAL